VITFDPLSQYRLEEGEWLIYDPETLKRFLKEAGRYSPFKILYQPRAESVLDNWWQVGVVAYARGNLLLCIDEMGMLAENGQFLQDGSPGPDPILKSIVHYGRHRKLDVICTAQRPTDVARRYTALCTEIRCFQTSEPSDLTYLQKRMGESAVSRLPGLPNYCFLHWTDAGSGIYRRKLKR
jgi:hypothetical protein